MGRRFAYIWTAEGWLFVAAVMDLYSRRIVGWSMSDTMQAKMVNDVLLMARLATRRADRVDAPQRPWQSIHERGLPDVAQGPRHYLQHEPARRLLGQRGHGELHSMVRLRIKVKRVLTLTMSTLASYFPL